MTQAKGARKRRPCGRSKHVDYDRVFAAVEARIGSIVDWVSKRSQLATELCETVEQLPDRESQERRVRELAGVEPWSVAFALLGEASRLLAGEPAQAASCAELAVAAAEEMDATAHPPSQKSGLLVHAYLLLADSRRRAGQIDEAEEALTRAEAHLVETFPEGSGSRSGRLLYRLRRVQMSFDRVHEKFDRMVALLEEGVADFDA
jgi:hypothetical protein